MDLNKISKVKNYKCIILGIFISTIFSYDFSDIYFKALKGYGIEGFIIAVAIALLLNSVEKVHELKLNKWFHRFVLAFYAITPV